MLSPEDERTPAAVTSVYEKAPDDIDPCAPTFAESAASGIRAVAVKAAAPPDLTTTTVNDSVFESATNDRSTVAVIDSFNSTVVAEGVTVRASS
jgi:hypothetical protein